MRVVLGCPCPLGVSALKIHGKEGGRQKGENKESGEEESEERTVGRKKGKVW